MLVVEFHCHTIFSKDSLTNPEKLVETCHRVGIDRVIVTDHNSIQGALVARALDPDLVIVGEEIMTTRGEILAAFVSNGIPAYLTPQETINRLKDQGAFISVSHPFDEFRTGGWQEKDLLEILPQVDAIEVFNSRCMVPRFNQRAHEFAEKYDIPGTVGSDAHTVLELGRSTLWLDDFDNADGLRQVIRRGRPRTRGSAWWVHLASRYASYIKKLKS
jgi:predicted metal-dependent phosphoesterase TrpH